MAERIWHPISKLEFFVEHTRRWLVEVRENAEALEEARTKPHVLADTAAREAYGQWGPSG